MQTTFVRQVSGSSPAPSSGQGHSFAATLPQPRDTGAAVIKSDANMKRQNGVALANGNGNGNGNANRALIEALIGSKIYQEYERAFGDMTGLPMVLQPVETWQLPHHGRRNENPFCALMSQKSRACAACLQTRERLCEKATHRTAVHLLSLRAVRHRRAGAVERPVDRLFCKPDNYSARSRPRPSLGGWPTRCRNGAWT